MTKSHLICKIFGHKISSLNTKRQYAKCFRCMKGLKVSYDFSYGETVVVGDYGKQSTFIWCDCGNELCSTESFDEYENLSDSDLVHYKCSKCGEKSEWDFEAPVPIRIYPKDYWCKCNCEIAYTKYYKDYCADCNKRVK